MEQEPLASRVDPQETPESMEKLGSPLREVVSVAFELPLFESVTTIRLSVVWSATLPKSTLVTLVLPEEDPAQPVISGQIESARKAITIGMRFFIDRTDK